jgi:chromosome segregation ATPase
MNSLSWKPAKNGNKSNQEFSPNIYRKPEVDSDAQKSISSSLPDDSSLEMYHTKAPPLTYKSVDTGKLNGKYVSQTEGYGSDESILSQMKVRYDAELEDYKKKQAELDTLVKDLSKRETELTGKCSILKSVMVRVEDKISDSEIVELDGKRTEFEKEKASLEKEFLQLRSDQDKYSEQAKKLEDNRKQLVVDISNYENELDAIQKKKSDIEEKTRLLEEQLSSGEEIELDGMQCSKALELIKSSYYSEMREINRKHADLKTLKSKTESEESELLNKQSALEKVRTQIKKDFLDMNPKIKRLDSMFSDYQFRLGEYERNEQSLLKSVSRYELDYASLKQKHAKELDKLSRLKSECFREESLLKEKMDNINNDKERSREMENSIALKEKQLDTRKKELDFEIALVKEKQKDNLKLKGNLEHGFNELQHKRKELNVLRDALNEEINTHVIIRRQHLDIKKLNKKQEQQSVYIKSLEGNMAKLQELLDEARSDVKKNEIFTNILKMNLDLSK